MMEIQEINIESNLYPEKLRNIKKPPYKLYAIGNVELLNKPSLAIIGTRHITEYGTKNCKYFTQKIVEKDIPIVSGMAIGTDSVAHKTALEFGGETIAVLPSGFDNVYPKANKNLFEKIINQNGLVITEYPPSTSANSDRFLERNRIVSGLSEGVLVIESAYRSGTSVTAKLAYQQGRVVMALPGRLDSSYGVGVNKLIQDGAKLITDIEDIIKCFPQFMDKLWKTEVAVQEVIWDIKDEYREIAGILKDKALPVEEIVQKTKDKNLREVLNLLINMELDGIVVEKMGEGYSLVREKVLYG